MDKLIAMALCATTLSACASAPDKISATYVSPMQYGSYDCDQVRAELFRVSSQVQEVSGVQNRAHRRDEWATGVGIVVFWPALFFLMEGDKKEELASLKGQYDALDEVAIQKKCSAADEIRTAQQTRAAQVAETATNAPVTARPIAPRPTSRHCGLAVATDPTQNACEAR